MKLSVGSDTTNPDAFEKQISLIDDKIKKAMAKNEQPHNQYERIPSEVQERIDKIDSDIKKLVQQSEYLGDAGKIEEFEKALAEIEQLRASKSELMKMAENPTMIAKQQKVCDICGAVQALNDTARRDETHLNGKIHLGFKKLRDELKNLQKRREVLKLTHKTYRNAKKDDNGGREASSSHKHERKEPVKEDRPAKRERSREKEKEKEKETQKRREDGDRDRKHSRDRHREKSREKSKERTRERPHEDKKRERSRSSDRKKSKKDRKRRSSRSRS
jgi:LUC7 N_terminus